MQRNVDKQKAFLLHSHSLFNKSITGPIENSKSFFFSCADETGRGTYTPIYIDVQWGGGTQKNGLHKMPQRVLMDPGPALETVRSLTLANSQPMHLGSLPHAPKTRTRLSSFLESSTGIFFAWSVKSLELKYIKIYLLAGAEESGNHVFF